MGWASFAVGFQSSLHLKVARNYSCMASTTAINNAATLRIFSSARVIILILFIIDVAIRQSDCI